MSKHFKNKTPSQTPRPLHESTPETKIHSPVSGADTVMPPAWHHSKPLIAAFKHSIAYPEGIELPPLSDMEVPLPWAQHQKEEVNDIANELVNEIMPDPEKIIPVKPHTHPPLL